MRELVDKRFEREVVWSMPRRPQHHRRDRDLQHVIVGASVRNPVGMFDQTFYGDGVDHAGLDWRRRHRGEDRRSYEPVKDSRRKTVSSKRSAYTVKECRPKPILLDVFFTGPDDFDGPFDS